LRLFNIQQGVDTSSLNICVFVPSGFPDADSNPRIVVFEAKFDSTIALKSMSVVYDQEIVGGGGEDDGIQESLVDFQVTSAAGRHTIWMLWEKSGKSSLRHMTFSNHTRGAWNQVIQTGRNFPVVSQFDKTTFGKYVAPYYSRSVISRAICTLAAQFHYDELVLLSSSDLENIVLFTVQGEEESFMGDSAMWRGFIGLCAGFDMEDARPVALGVHRETGIVVVLGAGGVEIVCEADAGHVLQTGGVVKGLPGGMGERICSGLQRVHEAMGKLVGELGSEFEGGAMDEFVRGYLLDSPLDETLDVACARFCQVAILPLFGEGDDAERGMAEELSMFADSMPVNDFKSIVDGLLKLFANGEMADGVNTQKPFPFMEDVAAETFQSVLSARIAILRRVSVSLILVTAMYNAPDAKVNLTSLGLNLDTVQRVILLYHSYTIIERVFCRERGHDDVKLFNKLIGSHYLGEMCFPSGNEFGFATHSVSNLIHATGIVTLATPFIDSTVDYSKGESATVHVSPKFVDFLGVLWGDGNARCMLGVLRDIPVIMRSGVISYMWGKGLVLYAGSYEGIDDDEIEGMWKESEVYFEKACPVGMVAWLICVAAGNQDVIGVLDKAAGGSAEGYYIHVAGFYKLAGRHEGVVVFTKKAIRAATNLDDTQLSLLWQTVFTNSIATRAFDEAYIAITSIPKINM
jgi:hypothetical protein